MEKIEGPIKIAGSLIALIIPCILLAGYSSHLGYITTYGLRGDLISKSMSDMLVESWYVGVMAVGWILSIWPYMLVGLIAYYLLFVGIFFFLVKVKKNGLTWPFEEITKENQGKVICGVTQWHRVCLGGLFNELWTWVSTPLLILAFIGLLMGLPFLDAKGYANEQIDILQKQGFNGNDKKVSCIYLLDRDKQQDKVLTEGILISANKNRIAIYNKKLEVWPLLDNYIVSRKEIVKSDDNESKTKN